MKRITALRASRGRGKRVNVFLDGKFAFNLLAEVAVTEGLKVGQELSERRIEALVSTDHYHRCLNAAFHYLSYRPRSESELRERLYRRGFDEESIEKVIAKLKEQGLVDDVAFAQFWKDSRETFSPRSRWLTKLELRRKGVAEEIMEKVIATIDDNDSAYRAALSKARCLSRAEYQDFRRRLGGYLKRRGFSYEVINRTVELLWREQGAP